MECVDFKLIEGERKKKNNARFDIYPIYKIPKRHSLLTITSLGNSVSQAKRTIG